MRIEHIALWTENLERFKQFYVTYLGAIAGDDYVNPAKGFKSCFLRFAQGARIEVMTTTTLSPVALAAEPADTPSVKMLIATHA